MTKSAITALTELTYLYATTSLANDLEAFSQHAGRRTITPEDVQLVARKNPDNLLSKLQDFANSALSTTAAIASTTTIQAKKKSPPKKKKKWSPPKQKKQQSPKSQRNKAMRERLLQRIDTDSDNTEMEEEEGTPPAVPAASSKSLWDFSDSEDSQKVAKENRKPAAQKRKAIVADDLVSSSSEEELAQRFQKMREKKRKEDLSNIADWSSDGASDEF
jgi:uncharacterized protein with von Willebrand factor type A (vWA) domain